VSTSTVTDIVRNDVALEELLRDAVSEEPGIHGQEPMEDIRGEELGMRV
jgi:hypothetical protein